MRTGLLRGADHTMEGRIAALAEGRAAIALSRGGALKTYRYRDPNEDACAFAYAGERALVAVADGHWGHGGATRALEHLLDRHAFRWLDPASQLLPSPWQEEAVDVLCDLNHTLLESAGKDLIGRTTFSLCILQPDLGRLRVLNIGDSHCFHVQGAMSRELCPSDPGDRPVFLGDPANDRERIASALRCEEISGVDAGVVVLATDGLSERGIGVEHPLSAATEAVEIARLGAIDLQPVDAARGLAERAQEAHRAQRAGDNIATACYWIA